MRQVVSCGLYMSHGTVILRLICVGVFALIIRKQESCNVLHEKI